MNDRFRSVVVIIATLTGFILAPVFVFSATLTNTTTSISKEIDSLNKQIEEQKKKIQQLEESIVDTNKKITTKQTEALSLKNQLAILDNRTTQVELDITATKEKLNTLTLEIEVLRLTIDQKQQAIRREKTMMAEFVRTLYFEQNKNLIEIMAAYDNFSEFYNRLQHLQTIQEDLSVSAQALRLAKEDLEQKHAQTEERKKSYDLLKADLDQKRKDLTEQTFAKETLLAETKSSEATYKTLLSNLRKQYQSTENEIASGERAMRLKLEQQKKLDEASMNDPQFENSDAMFSWPTASRYITAYFHDPGYPFRNVFEHNAIDIRASQGTPIRAAAAGYVGRVKSCTSSSCYSYIMLIHSDGFSTVYGHLSRIVASPDQFVARGDIIGYSGGMPGTVGAGPFVTGPHLHMEVRKNGIPVNPLQYLVRDY